MTAEPAQSRWRWWFAFTAPTLVFSALAAAALSIDHGTALYVAADHAPRLAKEFCLNVDNYGHLVGVLTAAAAIWILLPHGGRIASLALLAAVAGGSAANFVKLWVLRWRPRDITTLNPTWNSVWDSFASEPHAHIKLQSFPSSHTAVAFAVTLVLATALPKARWLFWVLAFGVAGGRVLRMAHFPSDVMAGAAVGYAVGFLIAHAGARWLRQENPAAEPKRVDLAAQLEPAGTSCAILPMRRAG